MCAYRKICVHLFYVCLTVRAHGSIKQNISSPKTYTHTYERIHIHTYTHSHICRYYMLGGKHFLPKYIHTRS